MTEKLPRPKVTDAVSFVSDIVRNAYWEECYQQRALKGAHEKLKWARELARRLEINQGVERAETDENGEVIRYDNLSQFVMEIVDDEESILNSHEACLVSAHNKVAYALTMLARTGFEIDVEEVQRQVKSELA